MAAIRGLGLGIAGLLLGACAAPPVNPLPPLPQVTRDQADARFLEAKSPAEFRETAALYDALLQAAEPGRRAELLCQLGKCRSGSGEYKEAVGVFGEALGLTLKPELQAEVYYRRGIAFSALWRPDAALADFRKVLEAPVEVRDRAVKEEEFLYRLGVTLQRCGRWADGRRHLERVAKDFPATDLAGQARERIPMNAFRLQLGTAPDEAGANRRAAEAAAKGLTAEAVPSAAFPGKHLVLAGRYARFDEAVRELDRVRSLGYPDAFPLP